MKLSKILRNSFLVVLASLVLTACATKKVSNQTQGDVYTGKETIKYLASGVKDRVFFATNETVLTTASRETLRKQASWWLLQFQLDMLLCWKWGLPAK